MSHVPNAGPPLQDYPGYFPVKIALWKRKWVQITGASLVAFMIGAGAGGATEPTAASDTSSGTTSAKTDSSASAALAKVKDEAHRLKAQVAAARQHEQSAIAQVQAQARTSQREAVNAAKAQMRAAAKTRQQQAVAAAVADAADGTSTSSGDSSNATDPRFSYCTEANDAGYGNYQQGVDPEYDWYDDNDGDGIVCEN
jgi:hypothetical protein